MWNNKNSVFITMRGEGILELKLKERGARVWGTILSGLINKVQWLPKTFKISIIYSFATKMLQIMRTDGRTDGQRVNGRT